MENNYQVARRTCLTALREFRTQIDAHLLSEKGGHRFDWTLEDCAHVQHCLNRAVDAILATCMKDHFAHDLRYYQNAYAAAMAEGDIQKCQAAMRAIIKEFSIVTAACKAIPKEG